MTRTFCRSCIAACGVEVDLDGDRVVRVRGDRSHPVSAGYACANGRAIGLLEHHPRRLLAPRVDGVVVTPSEAAASLAARLEGVPTALYQGTGAGFDASLWEAWRRLAAARGWRRCTSLTVDAVAKPYVAELVAGDARLVPHPDPDVLPCPTQLERPDVSLPTDLAQPIRIAQRTPALREAPPGVRSGSWWASALGGEAVDPTLRPGTATIAGGYPDAPVNELVSTDDLDPATGMPRLSGIAIDLQEQP